MSFGAVLVMAVGVAMDATAVAAARGLAAPVVRARQVALVAALFGGAQALMPLLGWFIGDRVGPLVATWDHWIAFALLAGIGGKMLWEARDTARAGEASTGRDAFDLRLLLVLAVATSIDAFAVGITLPLLDAPLLISLCTIGVTTAALSAAGVVLGRRFGHRLGHRLDAFGGIVLIGLGVKILIEHLRAG
jgi:manganese efflux pump family protein